VTNPEAFQDVVGLAVEDEVVAKDGVLAHAARLFQIRPVRTGPTKVRLVKGAAAVEAVLDADAAQVASVIQQTRLNLLNLGLLRQLVKLGIATAIPIEIFLLVFFQLDSSLITRPIDFIGLQLDCYLLFGFLCRLGLLLGLGLVLLGRILVLSVEFPFCSLCSTHRSSDGSILDSKTMSTGKSREGVKKGPTRKNGCISRTRVFTIFFSIIRLKQNTPIHPDQCGSCPPCRE